MFDVVCLCCDVFVCVLLMCSVCCVLFDLFLVVVVHVFVSIVSCCVLLSHVCC